MKSFEERLDKVLLKEDRKPKTGIWYYLWLKPKWKLWTYTYEDKHPSHLEAWQILAEDIANHYNLSDEKLEELKEVPYGLPRGRVDNNIPDFPTFFTSNKWYILHGDDFPLSKAGEIKRIVSIFNLVYVVNDVEVKVIGHEMMDPKHQERIQEILGPIPYDSK